LVASWAALSTLLMPALAAACPYCASTQNSGNGQTIALGAFIALPFIVTGVILKVIRSERGAPGSQNETSDPSGSRRIAE
jgi:ABC-type uncharacterized transport system permease subunit